MAVNPFTMQQTDNPFFQPENLLMMAGNVLAAPNFAQGAGGALQTLGTNVATAKEKTQANQQENRTRQWLAQQFPGQDFSNFSGETLKLASQEALKKRINPESDFRVLPDGTYGVFDGEKFNRLGKSETISDMPSEFRTWQLAQQNPGFAEYLKGTNKTGQTFEERKRMAQELGISEEDPRYQPFVATGKFPREDQQTLTAVDKKAILEADEMVAVNEGAIEALKTAKSVSDKANSGWFSGVRASAGANLWDYAVPDLISSPDSSNATIDFDNAVVGQALGQLKAIFGGAPTEGERKILLDLQGSSNLPKEAREKIIDRAIAAAERRLNFNRQRAEELRGNTYYKPREGQTTQTNPTGGQTKTGIKFSVEP